MSKKRSMLASREHEIAYLDIVAMLDRHKHLSSAEMLAIAANMLGKLIALQDQKTMTPEQAMEIVSLNIEEGNQQVLDGLLQSVGGHA